MAEKIVEIKGVVGSQAKVAASGITSADFEKLISNLDKKSSDMKSLISSVSNSSMQSYAKLVNILQNINTNSQQYNLSILGYLSGFQAVLFGYMETTKHSMFQLLKSVKNIEAAQTVIGKEPIIPTQSTTSSRNPYREISQIIHDKMIVDNKTTIEKIDLGDVIKALTRQQKIRIPGINIHMPSLDIITSKVSDLYTLNEMFMDEWLLKTSKAYAINMDDIFESTIEIHSTLEKIASSIGSAMGTPISVTPSPVQITSESYKIPISDNFETKLFEYLEKMITQPSTQNPYASATQTQQINQQVNYSGTISVREIVELLQKSTFYNPVQVEIFKKSFTGIANAIASGVSILTSSIKGKADVINSSTAMLTAISNMVSARTEATTGLKMFGTELLSFSRSSNPWSARNVNIFTNGFNQVTTSVKLGMEILNSTKINKDRIKNTVEVINTLSELLTGEDKTVNIKLFGKLITKIYAFNNKNAERFGNAWKLVTQSINEGFKTLNDLQVPKKRIVTSTVDTITSIMSIINIRDVEALSKTFRITFKNIISNLAVGIEEINKMEVPNTSKLKYITDATTIITHLVDSISPKHILNAISLRVMISNAMSSIRFALSELNQIKSITPDQERTVYVLNAITQSISSMTELKGFKPKRIAVLVDTINSITNSLTRLEKLSGAVEKGSDIFCNSVMKISDTLTRTDVTKGAKNIKMLSGGIAMLGLALFAFAVLTPVVLIASAGLVAFGMSLRAVGNTKSLRDIGLFTLSLATLGLAIWAFSEIVNVESLGKTVLGLATLAGAIWLFSGKGTKFLGVTTVGQAPYKTMLAVAVGLAGLGMSVWLWEKLNLGWNAVGQVAAGIAMLAGATWAYSKVKDVSILKMLGVSVGIGTLGLAIWAWQELDIKTETFGTLALGLGGLAAATFIYSKVSQKSLLMMAGTAVAVAMVGGAIALWNHFGITGTTALSVAMGVAALGLSSLAFIPVPITAGIAMGVVGIGLAALGFGVSQFRDVTTEQLIQIGLFTTSIGLASYLFANPLALVGAASMLAVGISVAALAIGMKIMVDAGIDKDKTNNFISSVSTLCNGYSSLAMTAVVAAATSVLLLPVVGTTVLLAGSLALVNAISLDSTKIIQFGESVKLLTEGYEELSLVSLGKSVLKAGMLIPITGTTYLVAGAIALISSIQIKPNSIKSFGLGMNDLVKAYDKLGLVSLVKANAKAIALLPLTVTTFGVALAIRTVQALDIDGTKLQSNAQAMGLFVSELVDVFGSAGEDVLKVKKGIWAVGDLASTVKSLADAVFMVASMEYTENEIINGKIVPKRIRKLTDADFLNVGVGIGKMLNALIEPLVTIGSQQDTYTIGGITIQNPFGSGNKVQKGIKALKGISEIFTPLAATVQSFANAGVTGPESDKAIQSLNKAIGTLVDGISKMFNQLSTVKVKDAKGVNKIIGTISTIFGPIQDLLKSISDTGVLSDDNKEGASKITNVMNSIVDTISSTLDKLSGIKDKKVINIVTKDLSSLFTTLSKADATGLRAVREELELIYDKLVQDKVWKNFKQNISYYEGTVARIKRSINSVDLEKAIVLKELALNINEANENDNIERLIVELQRLIDKVDTNTSAVTEQITNSNETQQTIINNLQSQNKQKSEETQQAQPQSDNNASMISRLSSEIGKLSTMLARPLLVKQQSGDVWLVENR